MKLDEIEKVVDYIERRDKKNKIGVVVVLVLDVLLVLLMLVLFLLKYKIWVFIIWIVLGTLNITFSILTLKYEKAKETLKEKIK